MTVNASDLDFQPPPPPGLGPALILSLLAHGLLVLALAWGVKWTRTDPMVAFNAEIWSPAVQEAAPAAPPPAPPSEPPPAPPQAAPASPPPMRELAQQREAEIALEKRRQQNERKKSEEAKALKDKQTKEQAERDRREREKARKADKEKADRELAEKKKADQVKAEKARKDEERRDAALREEMRKDQLRRAQQQAKASTPQTAAGSGTAESKGAAVQSAAPSSSYAGRIVQQIRDNTKYSNPDTDQQSVLVMVKTAPNGEIRETRIITGSGNRLFDEAVLRGIRKMGTVPRDIDGKIPEMLLREGLEIRVTL